LGQGLSLLRLWCALLAGLILAAAPAAPMPLRLTLAVGLGWPQLWLGLRRFCRHACTSWHIAIWCIHLMNSAFSCGVLSLPCPTLVQDWTEFATAGCFLLLSEQRGFCSEAMLARNLPRSPGTYDALTVSVPFLQSTGLRSLK